MHYYQFNIGDYAKKTSHLSPDEDITYRRLLDWYYDSELPITNNIPLVSRRLRVGSEFVEAVLTEFFVLDGNVWRNQQCDENISSYHLYLDKQKKNGSKGGRPKTQTKPTANPSLTQAEPKITLTTNQEPITNNHKPILKDIAVSVKTLPAVPIKKIGFDYTEKKWIGLDDNKDQIKVWAETYPGLDLRSEFQEMRAWLTSNPLNRKTNLPRFINTWLSKSQDGASKNKRKTFAEETHDFKEEQGKKAFSALSNADDETLKKWGLKK